VMDSFRAVMVFLPDEKSKFYRRKKRLCRIRQVARSLHDIESPFPSPRRQ
jgi:hypothetical protein